MRVEYRFYRKKNVANLLLLTFDQPIRFRYTQLSIYIIIIFIICTYYNKATCAHARIKNYFWYSKQNKNSKISCKSDTVPTYLLSCLCYIINYIDFDHFFHFKLDFNGHFDKFCLFLFERIYIRVYRNPLVL